MPWLDSTLLLQLVLGVEWKTGAALLNESEYGGAEFEDELLLLLVPKLGVWLFITSEGVELNEGVPLLNGSILEGALDGAKFQTFSPSPYDQDRRHRFKAVSKVR